MKLILKMKKFRLPFAALLASVYSITFAPQMVVGYQALEAVPEQEAAALVDEEIDPSAVIVRVDGVEITEGEVAGEMERMMARFGSVPPEQLAGMRDQLRQNILDHLITKQLLLNKVEELEITIEDAEFEETIEMISQQIPPGSSLSEQLASMGMSEEEFQEQLREEMLINQLFEQVLSDMEDPTEEEIAAYYEANPSEFAAEEEVQASHILIGAREGEGAAEREAAQAKAESIRQELIDGADFAELAGEHSDCPSGQRGGDLGSFGRGQMVPSFEHAAFSQAVGEVGEVVETDFGYHLIHVRERTEGETRDLDEAREEISQMLLGSKQNEVIEAYLEQLRQDAEIEIID